MAKSELEQLVSDIKKSTNQIAINRVDEVRVMKAMLNDKDYTIGVYDKGAGYIGQRSPHDEAVKFVKNVVAGATGLDNRDAMHLAENYEFTKKDANFLLSNMRDFLYTYAGTGRKINVMQSATTEACLFTKEIAPSTKRVPDKDNPGQTKSVSTSGYTKLVSASKCPKYNTDNI
jgi:DNA-binding NarL/FixJ family response regulator